MGLLVNKCVLIRADASLHIGSGHIMRCLVLAQALEENGYSVSFACRRQKGDLIDLIRSRGFTVYELSKPLKWIEPKNNSDYSAWLQVSWKEDAQSLLGLVSNVDLLVVDHYGLSVEWERYVKENLKCLVFAIDDLVRQHHADLILDQTLYRKEKEYRSLSSMGKILAGCEFALLDESFTYFRELASNKENKLASCVNILITMGGVDQPNATLKVLTSLLKIKAKYPIAVTVLLSQKAPHYSLVRGFSSKHSDWVNHIDFVDNMAEIMSSHCIAIGAPGSTSWERACLGIPSIVIPLADNQNDIASSLALSKAAINIELSNIEEQIEDAYKKIINNWKGYQKANLELCDGKGTMRVMKEILQLQ